MYVTLHGAHKTFSGHDEADSEDPLLLLILSTSGDKAVTTNPEVTSLSEKI